MTKPFTIALKAGERIYVNGAVLRPDRKVLIEFMNDVSFLLEHHILRPEQTTTPLRQLYFIVQTLLLEPGDRAGILVMFETTHAAMMKTFENETVLIGLASVKSLVRDGKTFDALKTIRALFPAEERILSAAAPRLAGGAAQASAATEAA
jgi:flagellar protein FlbT